MSTATLTGRIHYLTRELLPEVTLTVTVKEVAPEGIEAKLIASTTRLVSPGTSLAYTVQYDPRALDPARAYALSAELHQGGRLYKRSTASQRVDLFNTTSLDIQVDPVTWGQPGHFAGGIHGGNLIDNLTASGIHGGNLFDKA